MSAASDATLTIYPNGTFTEFSQGYVDAVAAGDGFSGTANWTTEGKGRGRVVTRRGFRRSYLGWIRAEVRATLGHATGCGCAATAGVCRELLAVEPALYTFAAVEGVEPTNNAAERALRHAVCWRKMSFGTDSPDGSRFVERVLTVVATCRQQSRDVLAVLGDAGQAARAGVRPPSLVPPPPSAA